MPKKTKMQRVNVKCRVCGHTPLWAVCQACRGRIGGRTMTPKKLQQLRAAGRASGKAKQDRARRAP